MSLLLYLCRIDLHGVSNCIKLFTLHVYSTLKNVCSVRITYRSQNDRYRYVILTRVPLCEPSMMWGTCPHTPHSASDEKCYIVYCILGLFLILLIVCISICLLFFFCIVSIKESHSKLYRFTEEQILCIVLNRYLRISNKIFLVFFT